MDPNHSVVGNRPESNKILSDELLLIDTKREKCIELIKQSSDIHEIIEKTKVDPDILSINGGQGIDLGQIIQILFQDQHFNNGKLNLQVMYL